MSRLAATGDYPHLAAVGTDVLLRSRFIFAGFPLKLRGGHGGATRAVALVG